MKPTRKLNRRSFFVAVAGTVATAGLVGVLGPEEARAQTGCSDSDRGQYGDPGGNGRRCGSGRPRTGITDRDSGPRADQPNYGRGVRQRACTDSDSGRYADHQGRGRRC